MQKGPPVSTGVVGPQEIYVYFFPRQSDIQCHLHHHQNSSRLMRVLRKYNLDLVFFINSPNLVIFSPFFQSFSPMQNCGRHYIPSNIKSLFVPKSGLVRTLIRTGSDPRPCETSRWRFSGSERSKLIHSLL